VHILQRNSLTLVHRTGPLAILFMLTRKWKRKGEKEKIKFKKNKWIQS
jgi:hypothetical protein